MSTRLLKFPEKQPEWRVIEAHKGYKTWWYIEQFQPDPLNPEGGTWKGVQEFQDKKSAMDQWEFLCTPLKTKVIAEG
jgi:hypothetical protein